MNQYTVFPLPLVFSSSEWSHSNTTKDFNVSLFAISVAIELKGRKWWTQKQSIKKKKIIEIHMLQSLTQTYWAYWIHIVEFWTSMLDSFDLAVIFYLEIWGVES